MGTLALPAIEVGSTWEEVDARFHEPRLVEVMGVLGNGKVMIRNKKTGRVTQASAERFDGKTHNYRKVSA